MRRSSLPGTQFRRMRPFRANRAFVRACVRPFRGNRALYAFACALKRESPATPGLRIERARRLPAVADTPVHIGTVEAERRLAVVRELADGRVEVEVFVRVLVEDVVRAQGQGPAVRGAIAHGCVEQPFGIEGLVACGQRGGGLARGVVAVPGRTQVQVPLLEVPGRADHGLGARIAFLDAAPLVATDAFET